MLSFDDSSSLFLDISRTGRLQQLESLQMKVFFILDKKVSATQMQTIMRMVVQDQYILEDAFAIVVQSLHDYFILNTTEPVDLSKSSRLSINKNLKTMARQTNKVFPSINPSMKSIYLCLDYSGSMSLGKYQTRISKANENMLKVFDEYIDDSDNVGFLRFDHEVDHNLQFGLQRKGEDSDRLREILSSATNTRGGTKMYGAILHALDSILQFPSSDDGETWIIALTDGASGDQPSDTSNHILNLNKLRYFPIHVIIVGVEVGISVVKTCEEFCTVTDGSAYIDARGGLDAMDEAFVKVASMITGSCVTMETF